MLSAVQTIIVERAAANTAIHWEAVLVTGVPAIAAAIASIIAAWLATRNKAHLRAIDRAVNGVEPGAPSLREKVEGVAQVLPGAQAHAEAIAADNAEPPA